MHIHTANSYSDLGICFTSTPMAPLFFLFREFINGMEMSLLVSLSHFIKRIKSYFSRGEGEKKKGEKKKKKEVKREGVIAFESGENLRMRARSRIVKPYAVCNSIQWRNNVRCTKDLCYEGAFSSFSRFFLEFYSVQLCTELEKRTHDSSDTIFMHSFPT